MDAAEGAPRGDIFRRGVKVLQKAGIESAVVDAMVLLAHATGTSPEKVLVDSDLALEPFQDAYFSEVILRRSRHETVSRIVGTREFMSLDFYVNNDVLDPRPETELLVERAVQFLESSPGPSTVIDIGTGSGAIAVSLAVYVPGINIVSVDISHAALAVAKVNAAKMRVLDKVSFVQADMVAAFSENSRVDLVVSNPPYVSEHEYEKLPIEVRRGDPELALIGGSRGTEFYPVIAEQSRGLLKPGGALMMEIGDRQAMEVARILEQYDYEDIQTYKDLAGTHRVITGMMTDA